MFELHCTHNQTTSLEMYCNVSSDFIDQQATIQSYSFVSQQAYTKTCDAL